MTKIKRLMSIFISIVIVFFIITNFDTIKNRLDDIFSATRDVSYKGGNEYQKSEEFLRISQTDDYVPYSYDDLINIFYSVLNHGWDELTFYCPDEYRDCLDDLAEISLNEVLLADINNYVHPYNTYSTINTLYDDTGKVTLTITYLYTDEEIAKIDDAINEIIADVYNDKVGLRDNIKYIHDYIIDNTKYDTEREKNNESQYDSSRMIGLLFEHYAVCSGYADTMAVVLNKLEVPNFKISSDTHVWNAVYIDGSWLHLDATWDDPVSTTGDDILDHSYFLITTDKLMTLDKDKKEHVFDTDFYLEFN